jgi:hypothetical protein
MGAELKHCFVSALATTLADAVTYPLELISTMVKSSNGRLSATRTAAQVIRDRGIRSLYKGFSTVTYTAFYPNIVYFSLYESLKRNARVLQSDPNVQPSAVVPFVCSLLAESGFVMVMVPFDTIQTRMQLQAVKYNYQGLSQGIAEVVRHEGIIRLFSASPLYIAQFLTYTPVQFTAYEWLKARQQRHQPEITLLQSIYFTILATSLAGWITNPVNTVIVRFQIQDFGRDDTKGWKQAKQIFSSLSFRELNKGLMVRLLERNINGLCYLPIYEMAGQYFHGSSTH